MTEQVIRRGVLLPPTVTVSRTYWEMVLAAINRLQVEKARELFWLDYALMAQSQRGYW